MGLDPYISKSQLSQDPYKNHSWDWIRIKTPAGSKSLSQLDWNFYEHYMDPQQDGEQIHARRAKTAFPPPWIDEVVRGCKKSPFPIG